MENGKINPDVKLEQQVITFLKHLKIAPQNNYFTCYSYAHPILNVIPFNTLLQGLITKIVLLVCTPDEIIVKKIGSGVSLGNLREENFENNIIRIPKSKIKKFEIKDFTVLGMDSGYLLTIEEDKKHYFHVAKITGNDFSTVNFLYLKQNNFFNLVTDNNTSYL